MFTIYEYMFKNNMCDEAFLQSCVPDAGLSQKEFEEIVGDKDVESTTQPKAE